MVRVRLRCDRSRGIGYFLMKLTNRRGAGAPARWATLFVVLALLLTTSVALAPRGRAATPDVLLGRNRIGEFQGVRGERFLAWQQNTRRDPNHYDVFARSIDGGSRFKVNARGTNGANGGIQDDVLVYQQFEGARSDLRFFDLDARDRSSPPRGVNTSQWEYWPSMSQDKLLFGRLADNGNRRIVLFDLKTRDAKVLDKLRGRGSFLAPGQVNGDWATWSRCPAGDDCDSDPLPRLHRARGADAQPRTRSAGIVDRARRHGRLRTLQGGVRRRRPAHLAIPWADPRPSCGASRAGTTSAARRSSTTLTDGQTIYYDHYAVRPGRGV